MPGIALRLSRSVHDPPVFVWVYGWMGARKGMNAMLEMHMPPVDLDREGGPSQVEGVELIVERLA